MKDIGELLKEHHLMHYTYYENPDRIIYTHDSGTTMQVTDFQKLVSILKKNNIKYQDMGLDVIMIDKE